MKRVLVLWPVGRSERIQQYLRNPGSYEMMDGLSRLPDFGYCVETIDPSRFLLNPLAHRGPLWGGFDVTRFLRVLGHYGRYDAFISIGDTSCFLLAWLKRTVRLKAPIVVVDPSLGYEYPKRRQIQHMLLPYVDRVVVFGRVQLEYLERVYGGAVRAAHVLHRMDTAFFAPSGAGTPAAESTGGPFVLSVGNDVMRDYETLAEAVDGLAVKVRVHTTRSISRRVPGNMEVISTWISYEDLRELYASTRCVVVPLRDAIHASGVNAVLEAMAMAKGIVISDSAGIADYVMPDDNALVVPVGDAGALRAAIVRLVESPEVATQLGRNARDFCDTHCNLVIYAKQLAHILDACLEVHRD